MSKYLILIALLCSSYAMADVPPEQVKEVEHLLNFVKTSKCIINRNGSEHTGEKGVKHIQRKYRYFKNDIKTTEDFIKYSATKSTMSGKYYTVTCPGKKAIKTKDWLFDELKIFRETSALKSGKEKHTEAIICKDPRPEICTMEYVPVCATLKDGRVKTYASGCSACSDKNVMSYLPGECK